MLRNFKLQMKPQLVPVSFFSILTKPTSRKTVASSDLAPDPSAGIDSGGVISQDFLDQFLLNSSFHYFEKVEKGRKMCSQLWYAGQKLSMAGKFMTTFCFSYDLSNQLWLRIAGYIHCLSSTYILIPYFVSLMKYAGQNLKTVMWLRMAGKFMST